MYQAESWKRVALTSLSAPPVTSTNLKLMRIGKLLHPSFFTHSDPRYDCIRAISYYKFMNFASIPESIPTDSICELYVPESFINEFYRLLKVLRTRWDAAGNNVWAIAGKRGFKSIRHIGIIYHMDHFNTLSNICNPRICRLLGMATPYPPPLHRNYTRNMMYNMVVMLHSTDLTVYELEELDPNNQLAPEHLEFDLHLKTEELVLHIDDVVNAWTHPLYGTRIRGLKISHNQHQLHGVDLTRPIDLNQWCPFIKTLELGVDGHVVFNLIGPSVPLLRNLQKFTLSVRYEYHSNTDRFSISRELLDIKDFIPSHVYIALEMHREFRFRHFQQLANSSQFSMWVGSNIHSADCNRAEEQEARKHVFPRISELSLHEPELCMRRFLEGVSFPNLKKLRAPICVIFCKIPANKPPQESFTQQEGYLNIDKRYKDFKNVAHLILDNVLPDAQSYPYLDFTLRGFKHLQHVEICNISSPNRYALFPYNSSLDIVEFMKSMCHHTSESAKNLELERFAREFDFTPQAPILPTSMSTLDRVRELSRVLISAVTVPPESLPKIRAGGRMLEDSNIYHVYFRELALYTIMTQLKQLKMVDLKIWDDFVPSPLLLKMIRQKANLCGHKRKVYRPVYMPRVGCTSARGGVGRMRSNRSPFRQARECQIDYIKLSHTDSNAVSQIYQNRMWSPERSVTEANNVTREDYQFSYNDLQPSGSKLRVWEFDLVKKRNAKLFGKRENKWRFVQQEQEQEQGEGEEPEEELLTMSFRFSFRDSDQCQLTFV